MATKKYNFPPEIIEQIGDGDNTVTTFDPTAFLYPDYIKLSVYGEAGLFIESFQSNINSEDDTIFSYTTDVIDTEVSIHDNPEIELELEGIFYDWSCGGIYYVATGDIPDENNVLPTNNFNCDSETGPYMSMDYYAHCGTPGTDPGFWEDSEYVMIIDSSIANMNPRNYTGDQWIQYNDSTGGHAACDSRDNIDERSITLLLHADTISTDQYCAEQNPDLDVYTYSTTTAPTSDPVAKYDTENSEWIEYDSPPPGIHNYVTSLVCYKLVGTQLDSEFITPDGVTPELEIFRDITDDGSINFYAKPNDTLDRNPQLFSEGNYTLQFDFLRDYQYSGSDTFYINEISPSRKEIRLYLKDSSYDIVDFDSAVQPDFIGKLGDPNILLPFECDGDLDHSNECQTADESCGTGGTCIATNPYYYNWTVQLTEGRSLPIVDYQFDSISDPDNTSLIVRLNIPVPIDLRVNDGIKISKEMFDTQTEEITYLEGEVPGEIVSGDGLEHADFGGLETADTENEVQDDYQSYAELSASVADSGVFNQIVSSSYDNLNIDYGNFSNHTFFGSAVSKIENFTKKVSDIEGYLSQVSESLVDWAPSFTKRRKELFSKIRTIKDGFTPYERFLYYDNQSQTSASAPGIGQNLAFTNPLSSSLKQRNTDGFETVYKLTSNDVANSAIYGKTNHIIDGTAKDKIGITLGKYRAEQAPFYNYSGSIYLSFLLRADAALTQSAPSLGMFWDNTNINPMPGVEFGNKIIPASTWGTESIQKGSYHSGSYSRFILAASQSYWKPISSSTEFLADPTNAATFNILKPFEQIQSQSNIPTGSGYEITLEEEYYSNLGTVVTASGIPFRGTMLPSGELFNLYWLSASAAGNNASISSSYFTDVKITTKNPLNAQIFSSVYKTGSSEWTTWYDDVIEDAKNYDERNVNSLFKNLPQFVQVSEQSDDLKRFINMLGEHYDLIRNHIDNYLNFYKTNYKSYDTVPKNLLPILAENFGWQLVSPFSASISNYYANVTDDLTDERSKQKIIESTWKKILNNLVYIYKSKGTLAAIRALLNVYGYPGDSLNIQELGGSTQPHNPEIFTDNISKLQSGLFNLSDNISFKKFREPMYFYRFNGDKDRVLKSSWGMESVTNPETVEFVLRPDLITDTDSKDKVLLRNSGSSTQNLWDLRLIQSSSNTSYGKLEFRLNNTYTGSNDITGSAVSMSTLYLPIQQGGTNWNIMLQRMSSSISGSKTQEYKLFAALQRDDKITEFSSVSMSISGGLVDSYVTGGADSNYYANQNWSGTGSLNPTGSSNLYIGLTYTGSLSEFRVWSNRLQVPKFKQHVLNKRSTVGNSITSSRLGIYYQYKMNENWKTGSSSPKIIDSNKNNVKDYSLTLNTSLLGTGKSLYVEDVIDIYKFSVRVGGLDQPNDNKIIIDPKTTIVSNLSHEVGSVRRLDDELENKRRHSDKLQIIRSPQRTINEFIIDNLSDYNISDYFSDPANLYTGSYDRLDNFRNDLFDHFDLDLNINKWIRANSKVFNKSNIDAISSILPARASADVGLLFEPSLLERNKIKHHEPSVGHGTDIGNVDTEIDIIEHYNFDKTELDIQLAGEFTAYPEDIISKLNLSNDGEIDVSTEDVGIPSYFIVKSKDINISVNDSISTGLNLLLTKNSEIKTLPDLEQNLLLTKNLEIKTLPNLEQNLLLTKNSEIFLIENTKIKMGFEMSPPPILAPIDNIVLDKISYKGIKTKKAIINLLESKFIQINKINIDPLPDVLQSVLTLKKTEINSSPDIEKSLLTIKDIEIDPIPDIEKSLLTIKDIEIDPMPDIIQDMQFNINSDINPIENIIELTTINEYEGFIGEIAASQTGSFIDLYLHSWGTGSDSVHFQSQNSKFGDEVNRFQNLNIDRWQNKFPYESRYIFQTIGDMEVISSSKVHDQNHSGDTDYNNHRNFLSREIRDKNKGHIYESFIKVGGNVRGPQNGRAIGKTSYYVTKSNGNFHYPSNHWINFSEDISRINFINGTQNVGGDYFESTKHIDYSTASAYTVQVAEEGHISVIKGPQKIDTLGKPRSRRT